MFAGVWQAEGMKKQGSDQAFHDRRYQERKRAEAARKPAKKKVDGEKSGTGGEKHGDQGRSGGKPLEPAESRAGSQSARNGSNFARPILPIIQD